MHARAYTRIPVSRGITGSYYVSQRTAESSCFLSIYRFAFRKAPASRATLSIPPATCCDLTRPFLRIREYARARMMLLHTHYRERENTGLLRSRYEIIPGGLASRKFITINRTRSDEHLAPQPAPGVLRARNSALRILQGRGFLRRAFTKTVSSHTDEKDDEIISFYARARVYVCVCIRTYAR